VEGLTGLLFGAAVFRFEGAGQLALALTLISVLIALAATDLDHRLLPNAIVGPASLAGLESANNPRNILLKSSAARPSIQHTCVMVARWTRNLHETSTCAYFCPCIAD
jgi:hypothetical protein